MRSECCFQALEIAQLIVKTGHANTQYMMLDAAKVRYVQFPNIGSAPPLSLDAPSPRVVHNDDGVPRFSRKLPETHRKYQLTVVASRFKSPRFETTSTR